MHTSTRAGTATVGLLLAVTAGLSGAVAQTAPALAASSVGGSIDRMEILDRARYWVDRNVIYSQNRTFADPGGKRYRTDCSGLVAEAWHMSTTGTYLDGGLNTGGFASYGGKTVLGSLHDLKAGDAILRNGHIELFARWKDTGDHRDGAYVYSLNGPADGDWAKGPTRNAHGQVGFNTWSDMTTYTPIRYNQVSDGPIWAPAVDGHLYREPDTTVAVIVGGAPARFTGMAELTAAGYGGQPITQVPAGYFMSLPQEPRNGTLIRDNTTQAISIVTGGAKYHLSPAEWAALGSPAAVNSPAGFIAGLDSVPVDGTLLRNPADGAIYLVAGTARYHLTGPQYQALGNPSFTNVPVGFINSLGATPVNGTHLRNRVDGAIYLTVGGAKYHLTSMAQLDEVGGPTFTDVPIEWISTFDDTVADNTYLRNPTDHAIYRIVGGTKHHLTLDEWTAAGRPAFTDVPVAFLDTFPTV